MADKQYTTAGFDATFNKKASIKYGVILGVISFALGLIVLFLTRSIQTFILLTSVSFGINTIVYILISLFFSYKLRGEYGGSWNFSVAVKAIFLMVLISTVIATLGTSVYVHQINPSLQEDVLRNTINITIEYMEVQGAPSDVIDERVATLEDQMNKIGNIQITDVLKGMMIAVLMQFIFSLVLAALTRNEKLAPRSVAAGNK